MSNELKKMKKINLYGGPGCGKSTVAAMLFAALKIKGYNAEIVTEYAKELVYDGIDLSKPNQNIQNQIMLEQARRELVFQNKVEFLVCDSPLLLNACYNGSDWAITIAKDLLDKDNEYHFYLTRGFEHFETLGRSHTKKQSEEIDSKMEDFLIAHKVKYKKIDGSSQGKVDEILHLIGKS